MIKTHKTFGKRLYGETLDPFKECCSTTNKVVMSNSTAVHESTTALHDSSKEGCDLVRALGDRSCLKVVPTPHPV